MSLLTVKVAVGAQEFDACEPDNMRRARRFIAERVREEGGSLRTIRAALRLDEGETVEAGPATYWINRF